MENVRHHGAKDQHILSGLVDILGADAESDLSAALISDEPRYRVPAARKALDLARSVSDKQPALAVRLLKQLTKATPEEAVLQKAEALRKALGTNSNT